MADVRVTFELLVDDFESGDDLRIEDAQVVLRRSWERYLEEGCDPQLVSNMLSPEDRWQHYDDLASYGAEIDIHSLIQELDEGLVLRDWDKFEERGAGAEELLAFCYDASDPWSFDDDVIESLLEKGVNPELLFTFSRGWLDWTIENKEMRVITGIIMLFEKYGLTIEAVNKWFDETFSDGRELNDLVHDCDDWKALGVDVGKLTDMWIAEWGRDYIDDRELPSCVPWRTMLQKVDIKAITDMASEYGMCCMLEDANWSDNIDIITQRYVEEVGYRDAHRDALIDLLEAGGNIDVKAFADCICVATLDDEERQYFLKVFQERTTDDEILSKFRQ